MTESNFTEDMVLNGIENEIERCFNSMESYIPSSQEYKILSERLAKLSEMRLQEIESQRAFYEQSEDGTRKGIELDLKCDQAKKQNIFQALKIGLDLAAILIPAGLYASVTKKGFLFEETGSITSETFKDVLRKMNPFKH